VGSFLLYTWWEKNKKFQQNYISIHLKTSYKKICLATMNVYCEKKSLNSDSQQFHHYQQNGQPPLTSNHWTQKDTMTFGIWNPGSGFGQAQKCGGY